MNMVKGLIEKLLNYIDNGKFFREPMRVFYLLNAIVPFLTPLLYLIVIVPLWGRMDYVLLGWTKICAIIALFLGFVWLLVLAYGTYVYWMNRRKALYRCFREGDDFKAIPLVANYIQCWGESYGLSLAIAPIGVYVIVYVMGLLCGFNIGYGFDFRIFLLCTLLGIVGLAVLCLAMFLLCYPIVMFAHFASEKLRVKANLANDMRDLADIHRASVS